MLWKFSSGWIFMAVLNTICPCESVECRQSRASEMPRSFWLYWKTITGYSYILSYDVASLCSVILHSGSITTQTLVYGDSLIFSVPFNDRNWSQIHGWTFVNVYTIMQCASAQPLWGNREEHARVGTEYWLLASGAGHTINCKGIIWLNTARVLYILHTAVRNLKILRLLRSSAFPFYKMNIYKRRMIKLYLCFCMRSYVMSSSNLYNFCIFEETADCCWKACHLKCNDVN